MEILKRNICSSKEQMARHKTRERNLSIELKREKYIPFIVGNSPKDILTPDKLIEQLNKYLLDNFKQATE